MSPPPSSWFALAVRPQHERIAARSLRYCGLEEYVPLYRSRRRWSDRLKEIELPLFAGYVFCRFSPQDRLTVLQTPGVISIVGFGNRPAALEEEELAAIRQAAGSGLAIEPWPFLRAGQGIRIERGPLAGLEGILVRAKDAWRVVISVELLKRSVAVELDRTAIVPLRASRRTAPLAFSYNRA